MHLARVTGTVTATSKDAQLSGRALLICELKSSTTHDQSIVAVDTVGAGVGDTVLITYGSAARLSAASAGTPTDAAIVAVVDHVNLA